MKESQKAKEWRKARGLSVERLSELSGYAVETIYCMERGHNPNGSKIVPWAWQRYRNVCAGIDAQIRSGINFDWGEHGWK